MVSKNIDKDVKTILVDIYELIDRRDWTAVLNLANKILALDPDHSDAQAFLRMAERIVSNLEGRNIAQREAVDRRREDAGQQAGSVEPIASEAFVGRTAEMDLLQAALEEALSGRGRMVMLVGEPGIGKTRTAEVIATHAELHGARVLWGRMHEEPGAPPFWPWVQLIRSYVRLQETEKLRKELGYGAGAVAKIVPEVRSRLPDIEQAPVFEDAQEGRFYLFDSLTTFLKNSAESAPLMLIIDNLHWADEPSLKLLQFLAHELGNARILVVGTYRDVELRRTHPLASALGDLSRERLFERIPLRGLSLDDVRRFIERAAGIDPPAALVETVYSNTEGNPLFITEVIRLIVQEKAFEPGAPPGTESWTFRIPEGVRDVIGRRLNTLSERCNQVLSVASVVGREFNAEVLTLLINDLPKERLAEVLGEAIRIRLIEELPDAMRCYRFSHKLVQETLAEELTTTRKVQLHARIAEALERYYGDGADEHAAELARHFAEARVLLGTEKLVRHSLIAGKRANEQGAYEEANAVLTRAIEAKGEQIVDDELAELYECLSTSLWADFNIERRTDIALALFEYYEREMRIPELVDTANSLKFVLAVAKKSRRLDAAEFMKRALKLADDSKIQDVQTLLKICALRHSLSRDEEQLETELKRLYAKAEEQNHPEAQVDALDQLGSLAKEQGKVRTAIRLWDQAFEIAPDTIDISLRCNVIRFMSAYLLKLGDPEAAIERHKQADAIAKKIRTPLIAAKQTEEFHELLLLKGEWQKIREQNKIYMTNLERLGKDDLNIAWPLAEQILLEYQVGAFELAEPYLSRLLGFLKNPDASAFIINVITETAIIPDLARITGENRWIDIAEKAACAAFDKGRIIWRLRNYGLLAVVREDKEQAAERYQYIFNRRGDLSGYFAHTLGLLASTAGELDIAAGHFEEAYAHTRDAGYHPDHAWICCDYADALLARVGKNDQDRAIALLREGLAIAAKLTMAPLQRRISDRLDRIKPDAGPSYPHGLTEREVEVLRLVTEGLTNKEIGAKLFVSPKTVASHIRHIFDKTGVTNRAGAAAYALRHEFHESGFEKKASETS